MPQPPGALWIGNPRYTRPLNPTDAHKWQRLAALGWRMHVIGFAHGWRPRRFTEMATFFLLPQPAQALLRYGLMFTLAPLIALWLVWRQDIRVIVAQSPFEGAIGAWVKQTARGLLRRRVALVVESHGNFEISVFQQREVRGSRLYRQLMAAASRAAFDQADAFRAISNMTARQLAPYAGGRPLVQFMTWTDAAVFRQARRSVAIEQAQDIVYAGVLIPRKGVHVLLEAFATLVEDFPECDLLLVGKPENPAYFEALRAQAVRLRLDGRIHFIGAVSQAELARWMGRGRVLALPSSSEGLGRVLVEGMLCGLPAVASDVDGIPDVVQPGMNGWLVPPNDSPALAAALRKALAMPAADIIPLSQRARAFAEAYFSEEAYVDGYRNLLETADARAQGESR